MPIRPVRSPAEEALLPTEFDAEAEFDRQTRTLLDLGHPAHAGMSAAEFTALVEPLRPAVLARAPEMAAATRARVPFALVVDTSLVPADRSMPLTQLKGKPGFADYEPDDLRAFEPVEGLALPSDPVYVVFDIDREKETLNATPDDAVAMITAKDRKPLTIAEGIAFITHHPDSLEKNNCFHTAGSRRADQRVPALWISKNRPKLGWCWARNRHSWLGVASCADRAGVSVDSGPI